MLSGPTMVMLLMISSGFWSFLRKRKKILGMCLIVND